MASRSAWPLLVVMACAAMISGCAASPTQYVLPSRYLRRMHQDVGGTANGDSTTEQRGNWTVHNAAFCSCPSPATDGESAYQPVCGYDAQTYGSECVMQCDNQVPFPNQQGKCDPSCWPPGAPTCPDGPNCDWVSRDPVCHGGITWFNAAEARANGRPESCFLPGVCNYGTRDGQPITYEPTTGGKGLNVADAASNTQLPDPSSAAAYDYSEALVKSLIYYDSMISGYIEPQYKRLDWRGDSCSGCTGAYGEDLSGGYFEAGGSTLKLNLVNGYTNIMLAWGALDFPAGFEATNTTADMKFKVKWGADYLLNAHINDTVFAGALGNDTDDFDYYGPIELYENYTKPRPAGYCTETYPCSEITADAAGALAAAYLLFKDDDPTWAANALDHARTLYAFATQYQGTYMNSADPVMQIHARLYASTGYYDELALAAAWMYRATGEDQYRTDASTFFPQAGDSNTLQAGEVKIAAAVLMAQLDPSNTQYADWAKNSFFDQYLTQTIRHTDAGLPYPYHWGALTHGVNLAFLTQYHNKNTAVDADYRARLFNYGQHQVNYILGDAGRSWMVGFGKDYPQYLWHKASYNSYLVWNSTEDPLGTLVWAGRDEGPWLTPLPGEKERYVQKAKFDMQGSYFPQRHIAYGALFGSPLLNDGLVMTRRDYSYAENTIAYQAPWPGALSAFVEYYNLGRWQGELQEVNEVDWSY